LKCSLIHCTGGEEKVEKTGRTCTFLKVLITMSEELSGGPGGSWGSKEKFSPGKTAGAPVGGLASSTTGARERSE